MKPSAIPRRESRLVLSGHSAQVNRIAYAPDGRTLATASDDRSVRLWEIESLQSRQLRGHTAPVVALAIGPDGRTIASGSGDWRNPKQPGELKLWDAVSGASVADLKGHAGPVFSVAFSPDGKTLASGSADGLVKLWDLAKRAELAKLDFGTGVWVRGLVFTPDGKTLASAHWDTVRLWDLATKKHVTDLKGHSEEINALAISPDGAMLATASRDRTAVLWDLASCQKRATLSKEKAWVTDVAFS